MKVLLSIKPQFAEKIFSREKRFEFRKAAFKNTSVTTVVLYVTRPVALIMGEFDLVGIESGSPESVWERTWQFAGISRDFFDSYYQGRSEAVALAIGKVRKFKRDIIPDVVMPNFYPPQSYMYIDDNLQRLPDTNGQPDLFAFAQNT
jgi:predicted transcriptional regulator